MLEAEIPPGSVVLGGRYEVIVCLGVGGNASVYRARSRDGQDIALKVMLAARARQPHEVKRFEREFGFGRALRYIDGITPALEHGRLPQLGLRPYIAFPFLKGEELDYKLIHGPLAPAPASRLVAQLARVVAKVHAAGVLHRDIKPSNVMLEPGGRVSLLDFGYARRLEDPSRPSGPTNLTRAHELAGTRHYMAPEQALGGAPSPSWDIYGLGMTLYEALVGDYAYSDLSGRESLQRRCDPNAKPLTIHQRNPALPGALATFVDRCLAYDVGRRPPTASAFADELEAISGALEDGGQDVPAVRPRAAAGAHSLGSGMQLGRYSIVAKLGQGLRASVYSAHDTLTDTHVALKVRVERCTGRPEGEREPVLEREAAALRAIGPHPHVVKLVEVGRAPGLDGPFLALEPIEGESLEDFIAHTPPPAAQVAEIAMQIARGLQACHRAGVVHGNLTPANVLLRRDNRRAVLIGFSHSSRSAAPSVDAYALGVVMFQMLTAAAVRPEYADRDVFLALQSRDRGAPPPLAVRDFGSAPAGLIELVNACVHPDPSARPPVTALADALQRMLPAGPPTASRPVADTAVPAAAAATFPAPDRPPYLLRAAGLAVAGLVGLVAVKLILPLEAQPARAGLSPPRLPAAAVTGLESAPPLDLQPGPEASLADAGTGDPPPTEIDPDLALRVGPSGPRVPPATGPGPLESGSLANGSEQPIPEPPASGPPLPSRTGSEPPVPRPPGSGPAASGPHRSDRRAPSARPKHSAPARTAACRQQPERARAAHAREDWREVLRATGDAACWSDPQERHTLRLSALRNSGRYDACVKLATRMGQHRTANYCRSRLLP